MSPPLAPVLVFGVVVLAGCGGTGAPEPVSPGELGLSAVAVYGRHAAVRGKVDVRIANDGRAALRLERLQVRHPMFAPLPATLRTSTIPADGAPRIVPAPSVSRSATGLTPEPPSSCSASAPTAGSRASSCRCATASRACLRAHRLACDAAAVQAAGSIAIGPLWSRDGSRLLISLRLERRSAGEVRVKQVSGNILFSVAVQREGDVLALAAGQPSATVELAVSATRCDPHALIESKRSFTFPVYASLDGAEPVLVQVSVDAPGRAALQRLLADTCRALGAPAS